MAVVIINHISQARTFMWGSLECQTIQTPYIAFLRAMQHSGARRPMHVGRRPDAAPRPSGGPMVLQGSRCSRWNEQ